MGHACANSQQLRRTKPGRREAFMRPCCIQQGISTYQGVRRCSTAQIHNRQNSNTWADFVGNTENKADGQRVAGQEIHDAPHVDHARRHVILFSSQSLRFTNECSKGFLSRSYISSVDGLSLCASGGNGHTRTAIPSTASELPQLHSFKVILAAQSRCSERLESITCTVAPWCRWLLISNPEVEPA